MSSMDDLPLTPTPLSTPPGGQAPRPIWPWIAGLVIVGAVAAGIWYFRRAPEPPAQPAPQAAPAPAPAPERTGLGPAVDPIDLPALDLTDPIVRDLIKRLSSRPEILAWLTTDGLIRNIAVCIENVSEGRSPSTHLGKIAPKQKFRAAPRQDRFVTDPRSFQRYDGLADTVASLDMAGVARLYSLLKPRLDEAYQQLGHPAGDLDNGTEKALVHLLGTPPMPEDPPLIEVVLSYRYADQSLEKLSAAQKQMLRLGPRNLPLVMAQLRALARELGIPESRLPQPPSAPATP